MGVFAGRRLGFTTLASAAMAAWYYRAMVFGI